jgi:hypothetical protein
MASYSGRRNSIAKGSVRKRNRYISKLSQETTLRFRF